MAQLKEAAQFQLSLSPTFPCCKRNRVDKARSRRAPFTLSEKKNSLAIDAEFSILRRWWRRLTCRRRWRCWCWLSLRRGCRARSRVTRTACTRPAPTRRCRDQTASPSPSRSLQGTLSSITAASSCPPATAGSLSPLTRRFPSSGPKSMRSHSSPSTPPPPLWCVESPIADAVYLDHKVFHFVELLHF